MPQSDLSRLIVGHRQPVAFLQKVIDGDHLNHAYLFVGPSRVGKTTLARAFCQALVCQSDTRPCGECRPCRLCARDIYPDLRVLQVGHADSEADDAPRQAAERSTSRSIRVEHIRALQHDATLAPYEGRWKVYVIADAQALTAEAANCLLKTLEEPPPHVVLILTVDDPQALPTTIVSRCQQLRLSAVPAAELEAALRERWHADAAQARLVARLAAGRPGWAIEALGNPALLGERSTRLADLLNLGGSGRAERFAYAEKLAQEYGRDPERVSRVLDLWLGWWRDVLLTRVGCEELVGNVDLLEELRRRARTLSLERIRAAVRSVEMAAHDLSRNVNPRLALEVLVLDLPSP